MYQFGITQTHHTNTSHKQEILIFPFQDVFERIAPEKYEANNDEELTALQKSSAPEENLYTS